MTMTEQELSYDAFARVYPDVAPKRHVKGCRYFRGGELAAPRDDRDPHEVRIVEHHDLGDGLTLEWAMLDRDLLSGGRVDASSYRVTNAKPPDPPPPVDLDDLDRKRAEYEARIAQEIARVNAARDDEVQRLETEDREIAEAEARDAETARANELWDAGAAARYEDETARMARDDESRAA